MLGPTVYTGTLNFAVLIQGPVSISTSWRTSAASAADRRPELGSSGASSASGSFQMLVGAKGRVPAGDGGRTARAPRVGGGGSGGPPRPGGVGGGGVSRAP